MACPYGRNVQQELKVLYDFEPNRYKAMINLMQDVYIYQGIQCTWDVQYMEVYYERYEVIEYRRKSMMYYFRNPLKQKFMSLLSGSIFSKKKAEESDILYNELLPQIENQEIKKRFETHYLTMVKPSWNQHNVLDYEFRQEKSQVAKDDVICWEAEYETLPGFYQVILSAQSTSYL